MQGRRGGEDHLAVTLGVQGVDVVIGVAALVLVEVVPAEKAVDPEEERVEPLRLPHRPVGKLVGREPRGERIDGSEAKEGDGHENPHLPRVEEPAHNAEPDHEDQEAKGLESPLEIASLCQLAKLLRGDRAAIPAHLQGFAHLGHGFALLRHGTYLHVRNSEGYGRDIMPRPKKIARRATSVP